MKIAIIGGGSVGSVLAVKLDRAGYDVTIVEKNLPSTIRIDNFVMYNIGGSFGDYSHLVRAIPSVDELDSDFDIIFVCTRLFDGVSILRQIRDKIKPDGAIVTVQNIFWLDRASALIPTQNAVFLHMDFICYKDRDIVRVVNQAGASLGIVAKEAFPQMQKVAEVLKSVCKVKQLTDIVGFLLGRNIINIAISMLGGVTGLRLGKILDQKIGRELFTRIISESIELFNTLGVRVCPYNDQFDYYLYVKDCHEGKCYRNKMLKILKTNNAKVGSSILLDLQTGKKSEIMTVIKTFIKHADLKKLSIPCIVELYNMIEEIISNQRRIDIKNLEIIGEKL